MLDILARSFEIASGAGARNHWGNRSRFDERRDAEFFPHTVKKRRD